MILCGIATKRGIMDIEENMAEIEETLQRLHEQDKKRWEVVAITLKERPPEEIEKVIEYYMNQSWSWLGCNNNYIYFARYMQKPMPGRR